MLNSLLAAADPIGFYTTVAVIFAAIAVTLIGFVMFVAQRYKRCPSNRVLVIYGKVSGGNTTRCVHGGAAFVVPLIQDYAYLSLEPIQIEVPLRGALSSENIRVNVPSVFTVAIGRKGRARLISAKPTVKSWKKVLSFPSWLGATSIHSWSTTNTAM